LIEGEMPAPDGSENPMEVAAEEPTAEEPAVEEPVTEPVVDEPVVEEPAPSGTQVFLLFGQSNMFGVPAPENQDMQINPRVEVLTLVNCQGQAADQWVPAQPPLHGCVGRPPGGQFGPGLGPGDTFARVMAEAWPEATIALVPAAIAGVDIDFFRKGVVSSRRGEFVIPPDNSRSSAYDMLLDKARAAQQRGTIRGMLFHQGESDAGNPGQWVGKVAGIVADLKSDLGLGDDVPFVAGELPFTGCCGGHNQFVRQLPNQIPNAHVVSAEGLGILGDGLHFTVQSQRELGRRYAQAYLGAISQ
jgi:hypothetical protein